MKCSYPLVRNVTSGSLKIISSLNYIQGFDNGSPGWCKCTPKTAFLVIFGHIWCMTGDLCHIVEGKLGLRSLLGNQNPSFPTKKLKDNRRSVVFRLPRIFPILRTPKCIGRMWCLRHQVNHLQTSRNFSSRSVS